MTELTVKRQNPNTIKLRYINTSHRIPHHIDGCCVREVDVDGTFAQAHGEVKEWVAAGKVIEQHLS
jgi:hypothetical protein